MAPRRPTVVHVVDVLHHAQRAQFLVTSGAQLSAQIKAACPQLRAALVDQVARLVIEHGGRVDLSGLALSVRHVRTLTTARPDPGLELAEVPQPPEQHPEGVQRAVRVPPPAVRPRWSEDDQEQTLRR